MKLLASALIFAPLWCKKSSKPCRGLRVKIATLTNGETSVAKNQVGTLDRPGNIAPGPMGLVKLLIPFVLTALFGWVLIGI